MPDIRFKEKFIGFVDVLGFKNLVQAAEEGTGITLQELLNILNKFGSSDERNNFGKYGPIICPKSRFMQRDLDFQLSKAHDCMVVSSEISPAGAINLIAHCWSVAMALLVRGIMCRGYITRGSIFHTAEHCIGTGQQRAIEYEKTVSAFKGRADESGTPFVEVDSNVCDYINSCEDWCVKEMFSRFVKSDGAVRALFPFQKLAHSFIIAKAGYTCNPEEERQDNQAMRFLLIDVKERVRQFVDNSNPRAVEKAEHYIRALDAQLETCDWIDQTLTALSAPMLKPIVVPDIFKKTETD
jgi:hypothetical protein